MPYRCNPAKQRYFFCMLSVFCKLGWPEATSQLSPPNDSSPQHRPFRNGPREMVVSRDRKSTRLNSSHGYISYAVFCLKKKNTTIVTAIVIFIALYCSVYKSAANHLRHLHTWGSRTLCTGISSSTLRYCPFSYLNSSSMA